MNESAGNDLYERWIAPVAGFAFVVIAAIAFFLYQQGSFETSQEFWSDFYDNRVAIQWQVYLYGVGGIPFIAFFALLAERLQWAPANRYLGLMIVAGAAMTFVCQLFWGMTRLAVTQILNSLNQGDVIPAGVGPLLDLGDAASTTTGLAAAVLVVAVGVAVLRSKALHQLYGVASLALAALLLVNGLLQVRWGGDWDTLGDVTFFLFLLWASAAAALLAIQPRQAPLMDDAALPESTAAL